MQALRAVHRAWIRKGSTFGILFHTRGSFWKSFSQSRGSRESFLACFPIFGRTLGALGANFYHKSGLDHQRRPKRDFPQYPFTFGDQFGSHFWSIFFLFIFEALFLSLVFLLSSGTDFSWILASSRHIFLIFLYTCRHLWF